VVFVSWSFVLCFVFPYSGILWLIEEVLTSLSPFLNHGKLRFLETYERYFLGEDVQKERTAGSVYLRPLKELTVFKKEHEV
jgi:hypothetical protein